MNDVVLQPFFIFEEVCDYVPSVYLRNDSVTLKYLIRKFFPVEVIIMVEVIII